MDQLNTERLELLKLDTSFCSTEYLSWINNSEVIRFLETEKGSTLFDLMQYLVSIQKAQVFAWAILVKETNEHIGNIKIDPIDFKNGYGEYGIMIGDKNAWGKGFAYEASKVVIKYCFDNLNLRKINLGVLEPNRAAVKLYNSLGFSTEGIYKKHKVFEGGYCDEIRMSIFNDKG